MMTLRKSSNSSLETERKYWHDRVVDDDKRNGANRRRRRQHGFPKHANASSLILCAILSIAVSLLWNRRDGASTGLAIESSIHGVDAFLPNRIGSRGRGSSCNLRLTHFCRKSPATSLFAIEGPTGTEQQNEASSSSSSSSSPKDYNTRYKIRDCEYRELDKVAGLVVESFYDKKKVSGVAKKLYVLAELNRLQQNFPHPGIRNVHRMLVVMADEHPGEASSDQPSVVGFCDIDTRPCSTTLKIPRPYLSDLAILPNHRRRGLARMLVEAAEEFVLGISSGDADKAPFDELWIRVASDNEGALGLYKDKLGYSFAEWTTGEEINTTESEKPKIWTLRKDLR